VDAIGRDIPKDRPVPVIIHEQLRASKPLS
jgi:hypothetical protein